jgi:hypothetical protein
MIVRKDLRETVGTRHARVAGSRTSRVVLGILATRTRLGRPAGKGRDRPCASSLPLRPDSVQTTFCAPRPMPRGDPRRMIRADLHGRVQGGIVQQLVQGDKTLAEVSRELDIQPSVIRTAKYQRDRQCFNARYHSVASLPIPTWASWRRSASRTSGVLNSSTRYCGSVQTRSVRPQNFASGGKVRRMR